MSISDHEKQRQPHHMHRGVKFQAIPVSPADTDTALQVVCFFDQTRNRTYAGGTAAVDGRLAGALGTLRAEDVFRGERFETLLLTPGADRLSAQRLLLIGLGDPENFGLDVLEVVGRVAVREAIKLGVASFCFAPSIKDAGVGGLAAGDVSVALVRGMSHAIATAQVLAGRGLAPPSALAEVVFLAGPQHLESSQAGLRAALEALAG